jgi:hypothetical protein
MNNRGTPKTPDGWIERLPEDYGPQDEDRCPVCGHIECKCEPEENETLPLSKRER